MSESYAEYNIDKSLDKDEELLIEGSNRYVLFPIRYQKIWEMYKKAESAFWSAEEIDLSKDWSDWEKLSENERHFIKHVLAFFAGSDGIVNENLSVRFMNDIKPQEAKSFYGFQIAMENIHCVSKDTLIYTSNGYFQIDKLAGQTVNVWNGKNFSETTVYTTSTNAELYRVQLSNGMHLDCTSKHRWVIESSDDFVNTEDLKLGDKIKSYSMHPYHVMPDPTIFNNPHEHGYMSFDTTSESYHPPMFNCRDQYDVPINYSISTKSKWLGGAVKRATINVEDFDKTICWSHHKLAFLENVQLLLTTLNVHSSLTPKPKVNQLELHIDYCNAKVLATFLNITIENTEFNEMESVYNVSISSVTKLNENGPTYCFEEPERHMGVFNGILTGQSETYSILIDQYIKDPQEKYKLLNAINTIPCIKKKADWAVKWIEDKNAPFAMRLVAFACVEGIFFSGAFCAIFWLKERGVMPGLCLSNEFISRDEALHTEFAILLYSMLNNRLPQELIHKMVTEAVEIEDEFINESIPCRLLGMNSDLMSQYIRYVADRLLLQLGYDKFYNVVNPFDFMDRINLEHKANFFEDRNSQYALANVGTDNKNFEFSTEADF